jgi:hypothetical protein
VSLVSTRGGSLTRVMFVLPDERALRRIAGSIAFFATRQYSMHVGVADVPPDGSCVSRYDGAYPGLSVAPLPGLAGDEWRPLAALVRGRLARRMGARHPERTVRVEGGTSSPADFVTRSLVALERAVPPAQAVMEVLREHRPDLLVVTRFGSVDAPYIDYLRAAHALRIRTLFVPLDGDDLDRGAVALEVPDCGGGGGGGPRRAPLGRLAAPASSAHTSRPTCSSIGSSAPEMSTTEPTDWTWDGGSCCSRSLMAHKRPGCG